MTNIFFVCRSSSPDREILFSFFIILVNYKNNGTLASADAPLINLPTGCQETFLKNELGKNIYRYYSQKSLSCGGSRDFCFLADCAIGVELEEY